MRTSARPGEAGRNAGLARPSQGPPESLVESQIHSPARQAREAPGRVGIGCQVDGGSALLERCRSVGRGAVFFFGLFHRVLCGLLLGALSFSPAQAAQAPDTPPVPLASIQEFLKAAPELGAGQAVQVSGIVTYHHRDGPLFIQDETAAGLFIDTLTNSTVAVGDWVEVTGRIWLNDYSPILKQCFYRATGRRGEVAPVPVSGADLSSGRFDMRLVRYEGKLAGAPEYRASNFALFLPDGPRGVWALLNGAEHGNVLSQLRPGSLLQVTGVCSVGRDEKNRPANLRIHLRSPGDITVLRGPPWWTWKKMLAALIGAGGIAILALGWGVTLRAKNQELKVRARQLRALTRQLTLAEQRERRRIAQILHDHLQQLLAAIKFQMSLLGRAGHAETKAALKEMDILLVESIQVARSLACEISPPILHQSPLLTCLQWLRRWMAEKHGLAVELVSEGAVPPLEEDVKVLLFESVRELLFNVVKHARVSAASVALRPVNRHGLEIAVQDAGAGFDPSRIGPTSESSTGFGLFHIRERLEGVGGQFVIQSAPGQGSRFRLTVPVRGADASQSSEWGGGAGSEGQAVPSGPASPESKISILLVDDHMVMREGLARMLSAEPDLEVIGQAADGQEAVSFVDHQRPEVILMDISMPRLNGIDATRMIHRKDPDIRIIGLSMFEDPEQANAMREAGAVHYLPKSAAGAALLQAIRSARPDGD